MRVSYLAVFVIVPFSSAIPILSNRDFFDDLGNVVKSAATEIGNIISSNATLSGITGAVKQSIDNPQLTVARIAVIKSLSETQNSLTQVSTQANSTGNTGVQALVVNAQRGLTTAHDGVNRIGDTLVSGKTPSKDDQKDVAVGIKTVRTAVNAMAPAITTPDEKLSSDISNAVNNVKSLQQGGQDVLSAASLTFADLGLPDNFADS